MTMSPIHELQEYIDENRTERSANGTFPFVPPEEFYLVDWFQTPSLVIALVGLVGNGPGLWLLGFRIKRNPFSVYILNLAAADALFLCFQFVTTTVDLDPDLYDSSLVTGLMYFRGLSYTVGLNLLTTISTTCCLSVLLPIWRRCHQSKHTSAVVCAVLWALYSLVWLTIFVLCYLQRVVNNCNNIHAILFVWSLLLTCVLCVSSLTLLLRVQCSSQRHQSPRLYLLVLLNVLVFLVFGVPLGIIGFIESYCQVPMPFWLPLLLACVNSSANPFIYFYLGIQRYRRRRETLRVVLQRALGDEQEVGDGVRNSPHINMQEATF